MVWWFCFGGGEAGRKAGHRDDGTGDGGGDGGGGRREGGVACHCDKLCGCVKRERGAKLAGERGRGIEYRLTAEE